jgi:hypothetical protein
MPSTCCWVSKPCLGQLRAFRDFGEAGSGHTLSYIIRYTNGVLALLEEMPRVRSNVRLKSVYPRITIGEGLGTTRPLPVDMNGRPFRPLVKDKP